MDYFNIWRGRGEGPIRIGKQIDIGENLYSLLYISCLREEYINAAIGRDSYEKVVEEEEEGLPTLAINQDKELNSESGEKDNEFEGGEKEEDETDDDVD